MSTNIRDDGVDVDDCSIVRNAAIINIICPGPVVSTDDIGVKSKDADAAATIEIAEQKLKVGKDMTYFMQLSAGCQGSETDSIRQEGTVSEVIGSDHFRVELENAHIVMARLSGRMRKDNVQVHVGDKVLDHRQVAKRADMQLAIARHALDMRAAGPAGLVIHHHRA